MTWRASCLRFLWLMPLTTKHLPLCELDHCLPCFLAAGPLLIDISTNVLLDHLLTIDSMITQIRSTAKKLSAPWYNCLYHATQVLISWVTRTWFCWRACRSIPMLNQLQFLRFNQIYAHDGQQKFLLIFLIIDYIFVNKVEYKVSFNTVRRAQYGLTHWGRVTHVRVINLGHHGVRYWLVAC